MAQCRHCGKELPPRGKFCPGCGKPREDGAAAPSSAPPPPLAAAQPVPAAHPAAPQQASIGGYKFAFTRWDAAALVGGLISAGLWYYWSSLDKGAMKKTDAGTPFLILAIPVLIIVFRKPIDALLRPLHAVKKHIPRLVLIGAGLALPYFVANYLYTHTYHNSTSGREYEYAKWSVILGTILSYAVLRIPDPGRLPGMRSLNAGALAVPWLLGSGWIIGLLAMHAGIDMAWADDFARDKTRLEDGLRTPGWAQTIAGTASTVISALVNGALVFQRSNNQPRREGEEQVRYTMDIRTEDERMSIAADGLDRLWIYAEILCSKASVNTRGLTSAISFNFGGSQYAEWMSIKSTKSYGGMKAVLAACTPPSPETEIGEDAEVTVNVHGATAEGEPIDVSFPLKLEGPLRMRIEVIS